MNELQTLGGVELLGEGASSFDHPEFAKVQTTLGDGVSARNYVLQSAAPSIRRATRSWTVVETSDVELLRGFAEAKTEQAYVEEDGTTRQVIVMDLAATLLFSGVWSVTAALLETSDPEPAGS